MRPARLLALLFAIALPACADEAPYALSPSAPESTGPRIRWDLGAHPLPEIPIPNDIATYADPNSPTGLRINPSAIAPTGLESKFREEFDELDGWGTYEAFTIPFDDDLDVANILRRHVGDNFTFADDAIYLIDLETGLPLPIDLGEGDFQFTRRSQDPLFYNDPRAGQQNIVLETVNEDTNHDGILQPSEDTNFDGYLGRAAIYPSTGNPYDNFTGFWDPTSRTLIGRPVLPLRENHRYAFVVTDRLVGIDGQPVRSPFPTVAHPEQAQYLAGLDGFFQHHNELYGALTYGPNRPDAATSNHVVFAWTFTTQTTVSEWFAVHDGLYGRGPFARLHDVAPQIQIANTVLGSSSCSDTDRMHPWVINPDQLTAFFQALWMFDGPSMQVQQAQLASYHDVAYAVIGTYESPFLLNDAPTTNIDQHAHWQINPHTGEIQHMGIAHIPFLLVVPKTHPNRPQPFPLAFYTHGYGAGITEMLSAAGVLAQNGIATIAIDGPTHGLPITPALLTQAQTLLRGSCGYNVGQTLFDNNRARDLNGNGIVDPAGDFWTAYVEHSRDNVRQYALDISQLVRAVRTSWDGHHLAGFDLDNNGNPGNDIAGDFDGNGVPDVGGTAPFYVLGESLGGIMTELLGAAEPDFRAATPFSGGGGLSDIAIRSSQGGIAEAVYLRLMGPIVVGVPAANYATELHGSCVNDGDCDPGSTCVANGSMHQCQTTRTACQPNQISIRVLETNVTDVGELEIACANLATTPTPGTPPDPAHETAAIQPNDDVCVYNEHNNVMRCARADAHGLFRVGLPADVGDPFVIQVFQGPVIQDYGNPIPSSSAQLRTQIQEFRVGELDPAHPNAAQCAQGCGHIPTDGLHECTTSTTPGCSAGYHPNYFIAHVGDQLVSPAEGLGMRRQSPEFRRFLTLAQPMLDKGDPINFAPYYFLNALPPGFTPPPTNTPLRHALISVSTAGDQNVPLNTGNAFARAAGVLPFLSSNAPPHLREYQSPSGLTALWNETPNRVLIDHYVLEGINWLNRWPVPLHPNALLDVDDLDEGMDGFGEQVLLPRMRLVRLARPMTESATDLDAVWAPRLHQPWMPQRDQPLAATMNYYVEFAGHHSVDESPRPDRPWDYTTYMYNLVGWFFASDGTDLYYATHPDTHRCMEDNSCPMYTGP